mgnify:FL=1|tara:strand:- start:207 stop:725 length:519 start_codon:yes stop_codon:yes gene_type:complete
MRITRRQLRSMIMEVVVASDAAKQTADQLKKQLKDDNPDASDEEIEAAAEKLTESEKREITLSQADKAIVACLKKEGGAAGMGMLVDAVQSLETKTKKLPKQLSSKAKIKNYIKKHPAVLTHKYKDIILIKGLPKAKLQEALEKVGFYKKYSYGLDDVPDKTKAHDDIIGHT